LEQLTHEAVVEAGVQATITHVTKIDDIMAYPIMSTPGLVINEVLKSSGRLPRKEEIVAWLKGRNMVTIKVFGTTPPCAKCKRVEQEALKAAAAFPGQVEVTKLDALGPEADQYGMMVTPAVVINDKLVATGKILSAAQFTEHIKKALGG